MRRADLINMMGCVAVGLVMEPENLMKAFRFMTGRILFVAVQAMKS
jgi:hypothetical protein